MARKKKKKEEENTERWLTTYADLISLLMIFFVVLFASSEVKRDKLLAISESLRRSLHKEAVMANSIGVAILSTPSRLSTTALTEKIEKDAKAFGIDKSVSFSTDEKGTIVSIVDSVFFKEGSAQLNDRILPLLLEVAQFCKDTGADIMIEGHTDNRKIRRPNPPRDNWELSTLRATNVVEFFIKNVNFNPSRISAVGYADTRPLVPNDTPGNRARNRRINIILKNAEVKSQKFGGNKALTQLDLIEREKQTKEDTLDRMLNPYKDGGDGTN